MLHSSLHAIEFNKHERILECKDCHKEGKPNKKVNKRTCIECHDSKPTESKTYIDGSTERNFNIHDSHQGELRCTLCHHNHSDSNLYCNQCHQFNINIK
ncbi:cytochrome c3 family protein [Shewanella sp. A14]